MKDSKGKPSGYWNIKENCLQESLKYKTRVEFQKGSKGAYLATRRNGWLDDICGHMERLRKPNGHWDIKENCKKEALKYKTRKEFHKGSPGPYNSSRINGWMDDICKHMQVVGNLKNRGIYVFEFEDNHAYVGLTSNFKKRYNKHMNNINSPVYKHIEETKLIPKFIQLTDYMDEELASKEETMWENKYVTNGWNMLNIMKTGGLGGFPKWDYDTCKKEALKYKTRNEFCKGCSGAYRSSCINGWLDEVCSHMIELMKPKGYWSKENCRKEALKYKSRYEFLKESRSAYNSSWKNKWLDEVCSHMIELIKPSGYWSKENCRKEALKYKSRYEFYKGSRSAYSSSMRNGWVDEFFPKTKRG